MRKTISILLACLVVGTCFVPSAAAIELQEATITYEAYGAVGDGVTDDFSAIIAAHNAANAADLPVRANDNATYYIGGGAKTAIIKTNTDWGNAKFIIDDTNLNDADLWRYVFHVASKHAAISITTVTSLQKGQANLGVTLPMACVVVVTDNTTRRFIRRGANQNEGAAQTDVFIVDRDGNIDPDVPLMWDYDSVTAMTAYPMDEDRLTVRGGHFTTLANQAGGKAYHERGIGVTRSNVEIADVTHVVTGEGAQGSPYNGFVHARDCANLTVRGCRFSGRKAYAKDFDDSLMGRISGLYTKRGTYDIRLHRVANAAFVDCRQMNSILDRSLWGVMCSDFSKNLSFEGCEFSRVDAHMGAYNVTIRNSTLGHAGITVTGFGTLLVENSTIQSNAIVDLRHDYGSFWDGEIVIRNCVFAPFAGQGGAFVDKLANWLRGAAIVSSVNDGQWDFGYPCMMPKKITIEGLVIDDKKHPPLYFGPRVFDHLSYTFGFKRETYPYAKTQEVTIKGLSIKSCRPLLKNKFWSLWLLRDTKVICL
ncbi:MAG: right-handed parallel beta-helix repeat-containing protein [Oscillospiraceae bacterium]|nr:right-handed parallel beta-helix repeat-containing protein [Oscillospiraceae bacterium]